MIISNLNITYCTCLKYTNRYFHHAIAKPDEAERILIAKDLNAKLYINRFTMCWDCREIRHPVKYADNIVTMMYGRRGRLFSACFCIECGMKKEKTGYAPGEVLVVQDQYHIICTRCGCLKLMRSTKRPGIWE